MPSEASRDREAGRFTLDGSDALEAHLAQLCDIALTRLLRLVPSQKLEALVLGGGYGRGQGGVLQTETGDQPYNDLEFYVFLRGNRLWNERVWKRGLCDLSERLSRPDALHLEFKIDSLARLRNSRISMFTYDLVSGHRILHGDPNAFQGCEHHLAADRIPLSEAARLLLNRCTGLLLAQELLQHPTLHDAAADFIGRNMAKARLAMGDATLVAWGQYHWDCRERHRRLSERAMNSTGESLPRAFDERPLSSPPAWFNQVVIEHAAGLKFKLHPSRIQKTRAQFEAEHRELSALALEVWLWLETRRLQCPFASVRSYALSGISKCADTARWRNFLSNHQTLGPASGVSAMAWRYPRERLFNSLPLLLGTTPQAPEDLRHLQRQLQTGATDWLGLVKAYRHIWESYA